MTFRKRCRTTIATLFVTLVAACGGSGDGNKGGAPANPPANPPAPATVQSVVVTPATASLEVGKTLQFSAVARDGNGSPVAGVTFTWSTSDATIATVGSDGMVVGVAAGTAVIRAQTGSVMSSPSMLTVNATPPVAGESSEGLIAAALAAGEIDAPTALAYRVFANYGDARLPAKYRGNDADLVESSVFADLDAAFDTLPAATQDQLAPFLMRPSSVGSWLDPNRPATSLARAAQTTGGALVRPQGRPTCYGILSNWLSVDPAGAPVRVWYDSTETGHAAIATYVATHIETTVWPRLITALGFKAPLDDKSLLPCDGGDGKLDIYIVKGLGPRGETTPELSPIYSGNRNATYIKLKSTLGPWVLEHSIAHEIAHAIHYAYPTAASQLSYGWFRDAFANWAALQVEPGNLSIAEQASCLFRSPELPLDDRSGGHCDPVGSPPVNRDYGAFLPLQFISNTQGAAAVRKIMEATQTVTTAFEAMDTTLPGGLKMQWPLYAQMLWNQAPIDQRAASFSKHDSLTNTPVLAKDQPNPIDANLNGKPSDETALDARVDNMSVRFYLFTFSDPETRSLMFHNTWQANRHQGQRVSVYALAKPEGKAWVEEDLTDYEWIGYCRDAKDQRLEALVLIVASGEWRGANPVVQAAQEPKVMRNNIGCWGYAGSTKRTYSSNQWSSGQTVLTVNPRFDYHPGGTPTQYTDLSTGRLRVPVAAPLFSGGEVVLTEQYAIDGCSYSASVSTSVGTIVLGGNSAGTIVVNNFLESFPDDLRASQEQVTGTAPRAYLANGVTDLTIKGTVSGSDTCPTTYTTAVGSWLLTRETAASSPTVAADGHLRGNYAANGPGDGFREFYEWDLAPIREP